MTDVYLVVCLVMFISLTECTVCPVLYPKHTEKVLELFKSTLIKSLWETKRVCLYLLFIPFGTRNYLLVVHRVL